jgi:ompA/motB domain protein
MRKQILALTALVALSANAQEYNKWSIDVNGGVNKPTYGFASGYATATPSLWTANGGVRYMFNNKFGLRLGGGYETFKEKKDTPKFESNLWNVNLQAVANVGRVLSFEDWTRDLGLLLHGGVGVGQLKADSFEKADNLGFVTLGLTPQVRLSNRITLLFDGSAYFYARQNRTFDGTSTTTKRGFQGLNFTGTVGLQIALGRNLVHADWYSDGTTTEGKLEERLAKAESDVASLAKRLDDKEDKMNDRNGNRIPDEVENYLNEKYGNLANAQKQDYTSGDSARELIEKGYINVYFDYNSSAPQKSSLWAADFVANYLKQNSGASVKVLGYADELGSENYNQKLSAKRAEVIKQLLVDRGVEASKLSFEGKGEDKTVNAKAANARQLARRATFELK